MALQANGVAFSLLHRRKPLSVKAVASENVSTLPGEEEKVKLGGSDLKVTKLGVGAWSWGDTTYWNDFQWNDRKLKAAKAAFNASIDSGINFFDTAEVYGAGITGAVNSETLIGSFIKERQKAGPVDVTIATKFAALPWRFGRGSVISALKRSLSRLGLSSVDLYQLHWPGIWGNEGYIDGLGDAVEMGLVKAVGVSNYSGNTPDQSFSLFALEKRLREAYNRLKIRGITLASNQVNYSLIYRIPEKNGVKAACDELGVTLIAYSPIAQGMLQPLLNRIKDIGQNYGKTSTQVVLNWLICQENVIPIPGAKNSEQATEFAGALGWKLKDPEIEELRSLAAETQPVIGFPVEKL
ncbi:hypothetical protein IEQ34_013164 [Dendrobium chrysotoxum]|uniref:NADP-dependent oxidoreductase domain-containing protein n=1 Tax=Dendrobium chrysotoxum TaxID=161865 RepID=A0AAV7GQW4_DENCH|nr:hypothetical protein IEQ34_013164 [Dendrobium chrysotoxum]